MIIGKKEFDLQKKGYIMGILNVTPDSFSDGGSYTTIDAALRQCEQMIKDGADLIDIGGESTRPGYTMISDEEEIMRTAPVIRAVKERFDIPVSLDTYKAGVAKAGIMEGADLINDIWGFKWDQSLASLVAETKVACCLMHNRKEAKYNNLLEDIRDDLEESLDIAFGQAFHRTRSY